VLRHAYDEALCMKTGGGADGVVICGGTLRGDSVYGPGMFLSPKLKAGDSRRLAGEITLGDVMEILPFEDPVVVLEMDGETIWSAMEGALGTWPAQEG
jgi:5'-nucleotidase